MATSVRWIFWGSFSVPLANLLVDPLYWLFLVSKHVHRRLDAIRVLYDVLGFLPQVLLLGFRVNQLIGFAFTRKASE